MIKKFTVYITILMFGFLSSKGQSEIKENSYSYAFLSSGQSNIIPAYYDSICMKLNLPMANNSPDSFMLRLWTSSMIGYQIMTLRRNGNNWEGHKYYYHSVNSLNEKPFKSLIPIQDLIDSLKRIDLKNLKSQFEIPGFKDDVDDGVTYILEAAYKDYFKAVTYHSPELFDDPDNKNFASIINLLKKYFRNY